VYSGKRYQGPKGYLKSTNMAMIPLILNRQATAFSISDEQQHKNEAAFRRQRENAKLYLCL